MASGSLSPILDGTSIRALLNEIGAEFAKQGLTAEIAVYGGAALLLLFDNRPATRDIDFVPVSGDAGELMSVADTVGARHGMPAGWFNDAVRMFASDRPDVTFLGEFPANEPSGLRVFLATPRYILAMKMLAMRSSLETNDALDVWNLLDECGISSIDEARDCMAKFFPGEVLPERNEEILRDLIADKEKRLPYDAMRYW